MSERWSFCTQYIYCPECARAVRKAARKQDYSQTNRGLGEFHTKCIIAAFAGSLGPQDSEDEADQLKEDIAKVICHPVRLAIFYDGSSRGQEMLTLIPKPKHG
jgi:hypothetical protein